MSVIMQSDRIRLIDFLTAHGGFWPTFSFSMSNLKVENVENGLTKVMDLKKDPHLTPVF